MNNLISLNPPASLESLQQATNQANFTMACDPLTGSLLRTLAASKPGGKFLEIGTGTGVGTCWILDGMDVRSTLVSIELNVASRAIANRFLSPDSRLKLLNIDAEEYLPSAIKDQFDFIFADTFPGKFHLLNEALALLKIGGLYIIDDLLPQTNWPTNHQSNVDRLITELENRPDLHITKMLWASGLIIATKIA